MRARNLKPGFFKNEELAKLPPLTRLLFAGLWCLADRSGRLEDRPARIKAEVLPYDSCNVDKMLDSLAAGPDPFIVRYEAQKTRYIAILHFPEHQNPHVREAASTIPAPDEHKTSTVLDTNEHGSSPADSPFSDSPFLDNTAKAVAHARERERVPDQAEPSQRWTARWVEACEEADRGTPPKTERAIFGRKVKQIPHLDPAIMEDTIDRMVADGKPPHLLSYVYGDVKRESQRELERIEFGGRHG